MLLIIVVVAALVGTGPILPNRIASIRCNVRYAAAVVVAVAVAVLSFPFFLFVFSIFKAYVRNYGIDSLLERDKSFWELCIHRKRDDDDNETFFLYVFYYALFSLCLCDDLWFFFSSLFLFWFGGYQCILHHTRCFASVCTRLMFAIFELIRNVST